MAQEVKKPRVKGFSNNGVKWEGQKDFDKDYESITILDKVKKTGEGENDFVIVKVVEITKTPIKEVIDADKDSVGVYNIIKQVMRTGDESLLPRDNGQCKVDFVGAPETLMEVKQMGVDAQKQFESLPKELTQKMDMKSFVDSLTQEQFDAFIKSVEARMKKKEGSDDE